MKILSSLLSVLEDKVMVIKNVVKLRLFEQAYNLVVNAQSLAKVAQK
jgi:hypothetical protein